MMHYEGLKTVKPRHFRVGSVLLALIPVALSFLLSTLSMLLIFSPSGYSKTVNSAVRSSSISNAEPEAPVCLYLFDIQKPAEIEEPPQPIDSTHMVVPEVDTSMKTYMDYRSITAKSSIQYRIQQSDKTWTDDYGFRRHGEYYLVAMGTYYSPSAGNTFLITLEDGVTLLAMTGDVKSDLHTDEQHQLRIEGGKANLLEFIVDIERIPDICRRSGNMGNAMDDYFSASIASISKLDTTFS